MLILLNVVYCKRAKLEGEQCYMNIKDVLNAY